MKYFISYVVKNETFFNTILEVDKTIQTEEDISEIEQHLTCRHELSGWNVDKIKGLNYKEI